MMVRMMVRMMIRMMIRMVCTMSTMFTMCTTCTICIMCTMCTMQTFAPKARRSTEGRPPKVNHRGSTEGRPSVVDFNLESNCNRSTILFTYLNKHIYILYIYKSHQCSNFNQSINVPILISGRGATFISDDIFCLGCWAPFLSRKDDYVAVH